VGKKLGAPNLEIEKCLESTEMARKFFRLKKKSVLKIFHWCWWGAERRVQRAQTREWGPPLVPTEILSKVYLNHAISFWAEKLHHLFSGPRKQIQQCNTISFREIRTVEINGSPCIVLYIMYCTVIYCYCCFNYVSLDTRSKIKLLLQIPKDLSCDWQVYRDWTTYLYLIWK
jgi:hypothetical protein